MSFQAILEPRVFWKASQLWKDAQAPPPEPGLYAWYFDRAPSSLVPLESCHSAGDLTLLYAGISPARRGSTQNLRKRLRQHFRGNTRASTLRTTLACLLWDELALEHQSVASRSLRLEAESESRLSRWMDEHGRVVWMTTPEPWIEEPLLIRTVSLPLNLRGNEDHPFYSRLRALRSGCR